MKEKKERKKTANISKYRHRDRKRPPKILLFVPVFVSGIYLYGSGADIISKAIAATVIFFALYIVISLIWHIKYRRMLCGASMKQVDAMSGEEFEDYLALMYSKKKSRTGEKLYSSVETTPKTRDYGADLLIRTKDGRKAVVQAKRYRKNIPESAVQQCIAAREYYDCDVGLVVTNSQFTEAAKTLARKCGVILIDRYRLGTDAMYNF